MKRINDIFQTMALMAVTFLAACSSEGERAVTDGGQPVPLEVLSDISVTEQTRATGTQWEVSDEIGIFATTAASGSNYTLIDGRYNPTNNQYVFGDTETETVVSGTSAYRLFNAASTPTILPDDFTAIHVYAYYPYNSEINTATAIPIGVSTQTSQKEIDFMRAEATTAADGSSPISRNNPSCRLHFRHKLCKVLFNVKAGAGFTHEQAATATNMTIAGQATAGTYNIYTDALTITAGTADIVALPMVAATGSDASFEAIILPNGTNNAAANRTLRVTVGSGANTHTYSCSLTTDASTGIPKFEAGNQYTINITLASTGLTLTCAITPWTTSAEVAGTASH